MRVHVLADGDDPVELARAADADAIGIAGGDGSLAPVAQVALERGVPFVCVPLGTRNHFARDAGVDRGDPIGSLAAFRGEERTVDVGVVNDRVFLNNVSLGVYARLVRRRERHRRRRLALARLRALWLTARDHSHLTATIQGERVVARVIFVGNNAYELDLFNVGARASLDEGLLHLYTLRGLLPRHWDDRKSASFVVDVRRSTVAAAIDGEPVQLEPPLRFEVRPRALRLLVPPGGDD